ncbi:MAG: cyclic-di-AMP receptor [Anaerolineae bacterium]|nr:cyclic-di-AMP receptor [Anaerolineae bacterium]
MPPRDSVNQLIIANVAGSQAGELTDRLTRSGFYVTQIDSSGGILYEATTTLLIGLDQAHLLQILDLVRECCHTRRRYVPAHVEAPLLEVQPMMIEAEVGGATVYTLNVERFEQI